MYLKDNDENFRHVGPNTPMGELLRRFWLPALLDRAPEAALHGDWYALLSNADRTAILS
jgi:hypothetical protein